MCGRSVFLGLSVAALMAFAVSNAVAVPIVVANDEVADAYANTSTPGISDLLPTGASWLGGNATTAAGNSSGIYRSPFDGSLSSADAGGGATAVNAGGAPLWNSAAYTYFAVGPSNLPNPAVLDFAGVDQTSFSFLWGSIDTYNFISFFLDGAALPVFILSSATPGIPIPADGGGASFVSITNILFDQIAFFSSPNNALEFSNIVTSAVPIPPALLLFGSGLAGFAYLARRRRNRSALGATA